jgi:hypothetical protein
LHFDFESTGRGGEKKGTFSQSGGVWGESGQLFANGGGGGCVGRAVPSRVTRTQRVFGFFAFVARFF